MKKYELVGVGGELKRVRALIDFANVSVGDIGGYVETYDNLSQEGDCWVYEEGIVTKGGRVNKHAKVYGIVLGGATVTDTAIVESGACVAYGANVGGATVVEIGSQIGKNAAILNNCDYITMQYVATAYKTSNGIWAWYGDRCRPMDDFKKAGDTYPEMREAYEMAKAFFDTMEEDKRSWIKEKAAHLLDNYEFDAQTMYVVRKSQRGYFNVEDYLQQLLSYEG